MLEAYGDIWQIEGDAIVITTNGAVRQDGACVMGRGIAAQAKERYPHLSYEIGYLLKSWGNEVFKFYCTPERVVSHPVDVRGHPMSIRYLPSDTMHVLGSVVYSFPVKHHWREPADLALIQASAQQLVNRVSEQRILVPRPGCGNGGRRWAEVEPILAPILDDRFVIVTYSPEDR